MRRIGVDCAKLAKGRGKSIGIYNVAKSVVTNMIEKLPEDVEVFVFGNEENRQDFEIPGVTFILSPLNLDSKISILAWELFQVNTYIKKYKIDTIFFPRGFTSFFCPVEDVILVHDLIPFFYDKYYPGVLGRFDNTYIMWRLKQSIKDAKKVITISDYSKKDILRIVPGIEDKITVILHGYDKRKDHYDTLPAAEDYILGVTSGLPHKNAKGIIESYIAYRKLSKEETPAKLKLIGLKELSLAGVTIPKEYENDIECMKFLKDDEYYSVFKNAKALVFLSLIEGFGLPPLEAMELGVPVICSNRTSLPEVVLDAGILVDPEDIENVGLKINELMNDDNMAKTLIAKGYENLSNFRWEDKILQYVKVLCS